MSEKNEFLDSPTSEKRQVDEENSQNQSNVKADDDEVNQSHISQSQASERQAKIERKPIPNDKNELIKHLIERLTIAEDSINAAHESLTKEREKKKAIMKELDEKTRTLNELIKSENESIQTKVQNEFKKTLNAAVSAKVKAETLKAEFESLNIEKDYLITELDENLMSSRREFMDLTSSYQFLATENYQNRVRIQELEQEKDSLIESNRGKDKMIEELKSELDEAKGTMQKLSDVQNVLNRILGSQELFTQKDQENLRINNNLATSKSKKDEKIEKNTGNFAGKSTEKKFNGNEDDFWYGNDSNEKYGGKMELNMDQYLSKMSQDGNNKSVNSSKVRDSQIAKKR